MDNYDDNLVSQALELVDEIDALEDDADDGQVALLLARAKGLELRHRHARGDRVEELLDDLHQGRLRTDGRDPVPYTGGVPRRGSAARAATWAAHTAEAVRGLGGETRALVSGSLDVPSLVEPSVAAIPHPNRLIDLFTNRVAIPGNAFEFYQQTVQVNAATAVADAQSKPPSTLTVVAVQDRCRVVAHLSEPAPIRLLADIPQFESWLSSEMVNGVLDGLETQIINGDGAGENMDGLLSLASTTVVGFDTDMVTTLRSALTALQLLGETPNGWTLHPTDAQEIDLLRWSTDGGFLSGGYATDTRPGVSGSSDNIFGAAIRRVVSPSVPQGTAILGDFTQLRVYVRENVRVDIDVSGADLFDKNLFKMRAEGRFGIGVLRPQAFAVCDLGTGGSV